MVSATKITPRFRDEGDVLEEIISAHEYNAQKSVDTGVVDSKYGKNGNFLLGHDLGIKIFYLWKRPIKVPAAKKYLSLGNI